MIHKQLLKRLKKAIKPVFSVILAVAVVVTGVPLFPGDHMGKAHAATINVGINPQRFNNVYGGETNVSWDYQTKTHDTTLETCTVTPNPPSSPPSDGGAYDPPTPYKFTKINLIKTVKDTGSKSYTEPWNGNYNVDETNGGTPAKEGTYTVCVVPSGAEEYFYFANATIDNPAPPAPKYIYVDPGTDRFATKHKIRGVAERGTEVFLDIQYKIRDEKDQQVPGERLQASVIVPFDNNGKNDGSHLTWARGKDFSGYFTEFPLRDNNKPEKYVREWEYELELNKYEVAQITATVKRLNTNPYFNTENDVKNQSPVSDMVQFLRYVAPEWSITWEALAGYYYKTESVKEVVDGSERIARYNLIEPYRDNRTLSVCEDNETFPGLFRRAGI